MVQGINRYLVCWTGRYFLRDGTCCIESRAMMMMMMMMLDDGRKWTRPCKHKFPS